MQKSLEIGILAVQGAFAEHAHSLDQVRRHLVSCTETENGGNDMSSAIHNFRIREVRLPEHLAGLDGLILPGGESTTLSVFLKKNGFQEKLAELVKYGNGKRIITWGTCAGLILLADRVVDVKEGGQLTLGGLDITATRNSYGRQNESFETVLDLNDEHLISTGTGTCRGVFIRAPGIQSVEGPNVKILATMNKGSKEKIPVAVQEGNLIATAFHPELTDDIRWHLYFIHQVARLQMQHANST